MSEKIEEIEREIENNKIFTIPFVSKNDAFRWMMLLGLMILGKISGDAIWRTIRSGRPG